MARWWNIPPRNWKDNTRTCLKSQGGHTRKRARGQSQRKPFPSGYRDPGQAHQRTAEPAGTGSQRRLRSQSLQRRDASRGEASVEDATLREPPCLLSVALSTGGIYHRCCVGKAGPGKAMPSSPTDEEFMQLSACRLAGLTALAVLLSGAAPSREGSLEDALQSIKPDAILQHI